MNFYFAHLLVALIINAALFLVLGLAFIRNYNALTRLEEELRQAWGQIETHLQRRYDALLAMSQVVQGYSSHEQAIDSVVAKARALMGSAGLGLAARVSSSSAAESAIGGYLGHIISITTSFPELKANAHFQELLGTVKETGNVVANRRESYNQDVGTYNAFLKKFPTRLYAMYLGFREAPYFAFSGAERNDMPEMRFSQEAVAQGALAGSHRFPPESDRIELPHKQHDSLPTSSDPQGETPQEGKDAHTE